MDLEKAYDRVDREALWSEQLLREGKVSEEQGGFRKGRGFIILIFVMFCFVVEYL